MNTLTKQNLTEEQKKARDVFLEAGILKKDFNSVSAVQSKSRQLKKINILASPICYFGVKRTLNRRSSQAKATKKITFFHTNNHKSNKNTPKSQNN